MAVYVYDDNRIFLSTPSARRATSAFCWTASPNGFLSTPSARRATWRPASRKTACTNFYPRPPRGGRRGPTGDVMARRNFYPRPPRGGRRRSAGLRIYTHRFLSTPSARRATNSICARTRNLEYFYPRPPRGGRQQKQRQNLYFQTNYTTFCTNLEEP